MQYFLDENFTPPAISPWCANFGAARDIIIPVRMEMTGAPIRLIEKPPNLRPLRNVAAAAIAAHSSIPQPFCLMNFIRYCSL